MTSHKCPDCGKEFEQIYEVHANEFEPFIAISVIEGLNAYGPIQVHKDVVCHRLNWVHIRFADDGEERLIKITKFDAEALGEAHTYHTEHPKQCQHEGCHEDGIPCYYDWLSDTPDGWYCGEHTREEGFCWGCGLFHMGIEDFDFSPNGLCYECREMLKAEMGDDDYYDEDADFSFDDAY